MDSCEIFKAQARKGGRGWVSEVKGKEAEYKGSRYKAINLAFKSTLPTSHTLPPENI